MRLFDNNEKIDKSNRTSDAMLLNGSSNQTIHTDTQASSSNNPSYNIIDGHKYGSVNSSTHSLDTKHL